MEELTKFVAPVSLLTAGIVGFLLGLAGRQVLDMLRGHRTPSLQDMLNAEAKVNAEERS